MPLTDSLKSSGTDRKLIQTLCVSVHDVAPHTWPLCERLLDAIGAVADIPVTLLVVPAYHRLPVMDSIGFDRLLEDRLARGDELALHGYAHLDEGPAPRSWRERFKRKIFTLNEGEFSAISASDAQQRLEMGLAWFGRHKWPAEGFVAPAWLLSDGAWQAVRKFPFKYTTTLKRFYLLPENQALLSPSLVYSARNSWGRWTSRAWNSTLAEALGDLPLVRLGLHPNDAKYPQLISHYQKLIEKFLATREPMTKSGFAKQWLANSSYMNSRLEPFQPNRTVDPDHFACGTALRPLQGAHGLAHPCRYAGRQQATPSPRSPLAMAPPWRVVAPCCAGKSPRPRLAHSG